jgi:hypothetical protein
MNATTRTARQILRNRRQENRAAKRPHTLASHALRAGLDADVASGVSGSLRSKGKQINVTGTAVRMFRKNADGQKIWRRPVKNARRYTIVEFAKLVAAYKPRAARYVAARTTLLAYAV